MFLLWSLTFIYSVSVLFSDKFYKSYLNISDEKENAASVKEHRQFSIWKSLDCWTEMGWKAGKFYGNVKSIGFSKILFQFHSNHLKLNNGVTMVGALVEYALILYWKQRNHHRWVLVRVIVLHPVFLFVKMFVRLWNIKARLSII